MALTTNRGQENGERNELGVISNPNLCPLRHSIEWFLSFQLRQLPLARLVCSYLDSVSLVPLVNKSLLYLGVRDFYIRYTSPSPQLIDKMFQHIVGSQKMVDESELKKYDKVLSLFCCYEKQCQSHLKH